MHHQQRPGPQGQRLLRVAHKLAHRLHAVLLLLRTALQLQRLPMQTLPQRAQVGQHPHGVEHLCIAQLALQKLRLSAHGLLRRLCRCHCVALPQPHQPHLDQGKKDRHKPQKRVQHEHHY